MCRLTPRMPGQGRTDLSMLTFILKFIQHPIGAFAAGILIMYVVLLYLDWSSRKEQAQKEREQTPEGQNELAVEFRATLAARDATISGLKREMQELKGTLHDASRSSQRLIKVSDKEKEAVAQQLHAAEAARAGLAEKLERLEADNRGIKAEAERLRGELAALEGELAECPQEEEVDRLAEEKERLSGHLTVYRQLLGDLESRIEGYQRKDTVEDTPPSTDLDQVTLAEENERLLHQVEQYKRLCVELETKVGAYRRSHTASDESPEERARVTQSLSEENRRLSQRMDEYVATIEQLRIDHEEVARLQAEHQRLGETFNARVAAETAALRETIGRLKEQLAVAEGQKASLIPQIERIEELQQALVGRDRDAARLREEIATVRRDSQALGQRHDAEMEHLRAEAGRSEAALGELEQANTGLHEEVARLNALITAKNKAVGEMEEIRSQLSRHLEILEPPRKLTNPESPVLSNDDLLAAINEPEIPKIHDTANKEGAYLYNVFLPKLVSGPRRIQVIPLIQEITGLSAAEAEALTNRIVIPIVKGVAKEKAFSIRDRFAAIGIQARVRHQL
jgi:chromosome segregation ATPase/ribosomal protein L7/L12